MGRLFRIKYKWSYDWDNTIAIKHSCFQSGRFFNDFNRR